jgi:tetratricopeptide (TPR) repeat protein
MIQSHVYAQDPVMDSLKLALKNAKHDTTRCSILNEMVEVEMDEKIWPIYNEQLKTISENNLKNKNTTLLRRVYLKHLSTALNNVGFIFMNQGNIDMALNNYHASLKIQEEINDTYGLAGSYNNIGFTYLNQGDVQKALEYYNKALILRYEQNDKFGIAVLLNNIGYAYQKQNAKIKALENYKKSLNIYQELNNKRGVATEFNNIGAIYGNGGDNLKALECYKKSLQLREEIGDAEGVTYSLNNISEALLNLGNISEAFNYAQKGYERALKLGYPENIKLTANRLAKIYKKQAKYEKALEMTEIYIQMRDSISNEETKKASIKKQFQYEYEKQAAADSVKHAEEQKVKNAQLQAQAASLKQEKTQRYALYGGLLLVIGFSIFVFNRFRVTQKQKKVIEEQKLLVDAAYEQLHEKNKEVMDSITYARRIQRALITPEAYIDKVLNKLNKNS